LWLKFEDMTTTIAFLSLFFGLIVGRYPVDKASGVDLAGATP